MTEKLIKQLQEENAKLRIKGFVNCNGIQINPESISKMSSIVFTNYRSDEYANHAGEIAVCLYMYGEDKPLIVYFKTIGEYRQFTSDISAVIAERLARGSQQRQPRGDWKDRVSTTSEQDTAPAL